MRDSEKATTGRYARVPYLGLLIRKHAEQPSEIPDAIKLHWLGLADGFIIKPAETNTSTLPPIVGDTTTTKIVADGDSNVAVGVHSNDVMVDRDYEDNRIVDVASYFAKPVDIWHGTFTTAGNWGDLLTSIDLWTAFNSVTMWKNKLSGFYTFRGTVVLRLVANPTPFHSGQLRLSFYPCEGIMQNEARAHVQYRENISQLPGVYLDMSENEVTMRIPYVAPSHYIELTSASPISWGRIYVHIFEILRTGTGPTTVDLTMWMSVEDAEVCGQIIPQSSGRKRRSRGNVVDRETNGGLGPISKILDSGVDLARSISAIPSLTSLAKPTEWALTAARGAASALGWSKPLSDEPSCRMVNDYNWFTVNCSGNSLAQPLSLMPDNKLATIYDAADAGQDEMSINYIKTRTAYIGDFQWNTAAGSGVSLYNRDIGPSQAINSVTDPNGNSLKLMPPYAFLGQLFGLWRGSIEVIFRIVKTGFHTGTIAFVWIPGPNPPPASVVWGVAAAYPYRVILDIQKGNEVCLRLPYLLPQDYVDSSTAMGRIYAYVVNPLIGPTTVSSVVDVMMLARGGPDLEFQWPVAPLYDPIMPQGYGSTDTTGDVACSTMGANEVVYDTHRSQLAIGEHVTSLLQLLKAEWNLAVTPTGDTDGFRNFIMLAHRFYACQSKSSGGGGFFTPTLQGDYLSRIAACFAFHRGGIRYRILDGSSGSAPNWGNYRAAVVGVSQGNAVFLQSGTIIDKVRGTYFSGINSINTRVYQSNCRNGSLAVQVPYYHRYRYSPCRLLTNSITDVSDVNPSAMLVVTGGAGQNTASDQSSSTMLLRSVADDFQFSYFVGIPQMMPAFIY